MNFHRIAALGAAVVFLAPAAGADALPDAQRLQSLDVFQLEYADDVQISPDGSRIVYVRVNHDIMTDRARRNLLIINSDGTNNRPLRSEAKNFSSAALVAGWHAARIRVGRGWLAAVVCALDGHGTDRVVEQPHRSAGRHCLVAGWKVDRVHASW